MDHRIHYYPITIKEGYLDTFGHMNNATYFMLFEEARWDILNNNDYGMVRIQESGLGPTILEAKIRFLKELKVLDKVMIESQLSSQERIVSKMTQRMMRDGVECCVAEFTFALFDLKKRKLVPPTEEWLKALR